MESEEQREPLAAAVAKLAMAMRGLSKADVLMLDTLVMTLCKAMPPLAGMLQSNLDALSSEPPTLEEDEIPAYQARLDRHKDTLALMVRDAR